jgi:hypothetical protein
MAAFGGDAMKQLLQRIDAAVLQRKFDRRPVGPIGALLSLTDDSWAGAVERAMGGCFDSFIVHSQRDLKTLVVRACRLPVSPGAWPRHLGPDMLDTT